MAVGTSGGVSWVIPRGIRMVMLDRVGIPSGVQVKKPPMIFIAQPPWNRKQKAMGFSVMECPFSPLPLRSMDTMSNPFSAFLGRTGRD